MTSMVHRLQTRTKYANHFLYLVCDYTMVINYTLVNDIIEIKQACIVTDSKITIKVSEFLYRGLALHYHAELVENAGQEIEAERNVLLGIKA